MTLSPESKTALQCYMEMAGKVREGLGPLDPEGYFLKVADGMEAWCACWKQLNPQHA
jgi:hypothetical protein